MAIVFADRVKVRSYSTGTAEFILETVVPGFQSFAAIGNGNECYYGIEDHAGNWEVGIGIYELDSTQQFLYRNTVISSSNSNSKVNFPAGGKSVYTTLPSSVAANIVASTTFAFRDIAVAGQTTVSAESTTDTLTLTAGTGIGITTSASTDTITISANTGAIEFAGSTISTNDSSSIIIDQAATITSNLTVGGDILPQTANGGDLGSSARPWRSLYVSNNTIYIGGVPLGIDANGALTVNGSLITGGGGGSSLVNGANTLSLGSDGVLTLPGGRTRIGALLDSDAIIANEDEAFGVVAQGTTGAVQLVWIEDLENAYTSNLAAVYVNSGGPGSVRIATGANGSPGPNHWEFNRDGELSFPDATVQTTAWTGTTLSVSSSAPTDKDFWFNTTDGRLYLKDNSIWVDASPQIPQQVPTDISDLTDLTGLLDNTGSGITFQYSRLQEGITNGSFVTSITGLNETGLSLTSNRWAQLMWVPDITTVTLNDIDYGGNTYTWAYTDDSGFTVENRRSGSPTKTWVFKPNGTTEFPNYTFPSADGAANQVLKTDGNGNLTWTSATVDLTGYATESFVTSQGYITGLSWNQLTDKPNLAGTYSWSIAADDSTQLEISAGNLVKFKGSGNITTSSDADGNITITGATPDRLTSNARSAVLNSNGTFSLPTLTAAPAGPQAGQMALADGVSWNPLSQTGTSTYMVIYTGTGWLGLGGGVTMDQVYSAILELGT
jgi:hypothetical protein